MIDLDLFEELDCGWTAQWRREKAAQYPFDAGRNLAAADNLDRVEEQLESAIPKHQHRLDELVAMAETLDDKVQVRLFTELAERKSALLRNVGFRGAYTADEVIAAYLDDFEHLVRGVADRATDLLKEVKSTRKVKVPPKTDVGKAVLKNHLQIVLSAEALLHLIDARLESLRAERPNSDEGLAIRNEAIAYHDDLKQKLETLRGATLSFSTGKNGEDQVVKAVNSFAKGVGDWWAKNCGRICDKTYNLGLFLFGVSICSLAGAGGPMAVAVSGAIVGGKPVVDVVKSLFKLNGSPPPPMT
jgi:predicted DNA-binding protein